MGPDTADLLVSRGPPPPNLKLYDAGNAPLNVTEVGTLVFAFSNGSGLTSMIPKKMIQMIRAQVGYRVQTVATLSDSPPARNGRLTTFGYVDEVPELVDVFSITGSEPGAACPLL